MDASWVKDFYARQDEWADVSRDPITDMHRGSHATYSV
jgi:hypothetical protein